MSIKRRSIIAVCTVVTLLAVLVFYSQESSVQAIRAVKSLNPTEQRAEEDPPSALSAQPGSVGETANRAELSAMTRSAAKDERLGADTMGRQVLVRLPCDLSFASHSLLCYYAILGKEGKAALQAAMGLSPAAIPRVSEIRCAQDSLRPFLFHAAPAPAVLSCTDANENE